MALRHAKQLKLTKGSREKYTSLLNRVNEVLSVIENAESTKKVCQHRRNVYVSIGEMF